MRAVPARYNDLLETVDTVRCAMPLSEAPEHSYAAVKGMVADWERRQKQRRWIPALAAAAVLVAAVIGWRASTARSVYEQFGAQAYRNYARRRFPLDIVSSQPQVVSD